MTVRTVVFSACITLLLSAGAAPAAEPSSEQKPGASVHGMDRGMGRGMNKDMHQGMMTMHTADSLKWGAAPPSLPEGAQVAILEGDPMKEGPYVIRLKMPAGYKVPPHSHRKAENLTIMSGSVSFGAGEKMDPKAARELTAGGFYALGANEIHYAISQHGAVVQIQSEGPFDIQYVNPADNPEATRKQSK